MCADNTSELTFESAQTRPQRKLKAGVRPIERKGLARAAQLGASELQTYVEKITGCRLEVVSAPTGVMPVKISVSSSASVMSFLARLGFQAPRNFALVEGLIRYSTMNSCCIRLCTRPPRVCSTATAAYRPRKRCRSDATHSFKASGACSRWSRSSFSLPGMARHSAAALSSQFGSATYSPTYSQTYSITTPE